MLLIPPRQVQLHLAALGKKRSSVVICVQFGARTAVEAAEELRSLLTVLRTDYVDVVTMYYVETAAEWAEITAAGGALEYLHEAKRDGMVRRIGVTSHQRPLAAS